MAPYGKALSRSSAIVAYLFCNDLDANGHAVGYPNRNFYRYHDVLTAVATDSNFLADDLRTRFQLPPSHKLVVLNTPVELAIPLVPPPAEDAGRRRQVFWAGRFTRQKRVDVVASIAERLPEVDFRLWGATKNEAALLSLPTNVAVEGTYENFADLPLSQCDLWLYTSQWDGVPNMLFEVASTGIPLVSSLSGGCGEVLIEGLCERIAQVENVDAFVRSIGTVLADPAAARDRARMLRDRIRVERTPVAYRDAVAHLLLKAPPS
jgi:glycosyltransferase involved in cell wall biosynthesis